MPPRPMAGVLVAVACSVMYTLVLACRSYDTMGSRISSKEGRVPSRKKCNDFSAVFCSCSRDGRHACSLQPDMV